MSMRTRRPVDAAEDQSCADHSSHPAGVEAGPPVNSRRRFVRNLGLGAAAIGAAAVAGPALAQTAAAQEAGGELPDLSQGDIDITRFLQGMEMACAAAYTSAAVNPLVDSPTAQVFRTYSSHHTAAADSLGALLADDEQAAGPNATLLSQLSDTLQGAADQNAILTAMSDLEERMAATQLRDIALVESFRVARPIAKIQPVEAQQSAMLAAAAGAPVSEWMPEMDTTDGAFEAAQYPARLMSADRTNAEEVPEMPDTTPDTTGPATHRRAFLMGGATLAAGAFLAACGSESTSGQMPVTGSVPAAPDTTTTTMPGSPETDKTWILTLQSIELLAAQTMQRVIDGDWVTDQQVLSLLQLIEDQHNAHADSLGEAARSLGATPVTEPNQFLLETDIDPAIEGVTDATSALGVAEEIENVATQSATKAAGDLTTGELRQTALSVAGSDAVHLSGLRLALEQDPVSLPLMATGAAINRQGYIQS